MRRAFLTLAALAIVAATAPARAQALPPGFEVQTVADGLHGPVGAAWAPDGRIFVAEKRGVVQAFAADGTRQADPVIDISDHVNDFVDRGLMGIALDKSFDTNGFMYLLYVYEPNGVPWDPAPKTQRLTKVKVVDGHAVEVGGQLETVLLGSVGTAPCLVPANTLDCLPVDNESHAIGTVRTDPVDGTLWVGSGDGADYAQVDPRSLRVLDEASLNGKIIHIDTNGHGIAGHPFCPGETDLTLVCTKLYAKGFRNPFRFNLRSGGLGPVVADVGWRTAEELDFVEAGGNYGWPCYEGGAGTPNGAQTPGWDADPRCAAWYALADVKPPFYDYGHTSAGGAVIGGPELPASGGNYPAEYGSKIVYGDYVFRYITSIDPVTKARTDLVPDVAPVEITRSSDGNVAWVEPQNWGDDGVVRELVYAPANKTPIAVASSPAQNGSDAYTVQLSSAGTNDPDDTGLTYHWTFGDGTPASTEASPTHHYAEANGVRRYSVTLTVTDPHGAHDAASITVVPNGRAPSVTMDTPLEGSKYRDGQTLSLTATPTDADAPASDTNLTWSVILYHVDHIHFVAEYRNRATAEVTTLLDHDADSFYEITVEAKDKHGLTSTVSRALYPETVPITLLSDPPGAPMSYTGLLIANPFTDVPAAIGFVTSVSAAAAFESGGRTRQFDHWSDGGAQLHNIVVPPTPLTLTAYYTPGSASDATAGTILPSDTPQADTTAPPKGPRVSFAAHGAVDARRGILTGRAADGDGVKKVRIALRLAGTHGGCRWWSPSHRRLQSFRHRCATPAYMTAKLTHRSGRYTWRLALGAPLRPGTYVALFHAADGDGNVSDGRVGRIVVRRARR